MCDIVDIPAEEADTPGNMDIVSREDVDAVGEEECYGRLEMTKNKLRVLFSFADGVDLCVIEPFHSLPEADNNHGALARACVRYRQGSSSIAIELEDGSIPEYLCWPIYFGETQSPFVPEEIDEYIARCEGEECYYACPEM